MRSSSPGAMSRTVAHTSATRALSTRMYELTMSDSLGLPVRGSIMWCWRWPLLCQLRFMLELTASAPCCMRVEPICLEASTGCSSANSMGSGERTKMSPPPFMMKCGVPTLATSSPSRSMSQPLPKPPKSRLISVSYTHLTLPTSDLV